MEKGHGRREKRTLRTTTILTLHHKWPGMKQGFELRRQRSAGGATTEEVLYGITSLAETEADAARLLEIIRDHWRIENCLHYVRDVTLGEDGCRVRRGSAAQVLGALRNVVVHLVSEHAATAKPKTSRQGAVEHFAANPRQAVQTLGFAWPE